MMTNRCFLQVALLVCFCTTALSTNHKSLQCRQRRRNSASQRLLELLNGSSTDCLEERINSTLPEEVKLPPPKLQEGDAVRVTYEMLEKIFVLFFNHNFTSTGWNKSIMRKFFANLNKQMKQLDTILDKITEEDEFIWADKTIQKLQKYYSSLVQYLEVHKYGSCAWMIVKTEIYRNIFFLKKLTEYLPNGNAEGSRITQC